MDDVIVANGGNVSELSILGIPPTRPVSIERKRTRKRKRHPLPPQYLFIHISHLPQSHLDYLSLPCHQSFYHSPISEALQS
ncbi:hypothetical protein BJ508DRAFT_69815 [Ascobolus immersus RN42]|uniref:Uncharacterized protein n=1 Tax=Ascobolus immersus RN42 TaxID=1160509 RepID=A0A3N4ICT6_ASCIM|nr:hypothetical protein BJ508DRAFT_69815 [Ascobolus immersus RN42]